MFLFYFVCQNIINEISSDSWIEAYAMIFFFFYINFPISNFIILLPINFFLFSRFSYNIHLTNDITNLDSLP